MEKKERKGCQQLKTGFCKTEFATKISQILKKKLVLEFAKQLEQQKLLCGYYEWQCNPSNAKHVRGPFRGKMTLSLSRRPNLSSVLPVFDVLKENGVIFWLIQFSPKFLIELTSSQIWSKIKLRHCVKIYLIVSKSLSLIPFFSSTLSHPKRPMLLN